MLVAILGALVALPVAFIGCGFPSASSGANLGAGGLGPGGSGDDVVSSGDGLEQGGATASSTLASTVSSVGGSGGGCVDPDEPNESEVLAKHLGTMSDCDGDASTLNGILGRAKDVDFFDFSGTDEVGCGSNATIHTDDPVHLCLFVACTLGATTIKSCTGTPDESPVHIGGCCIDGPGDLSIVHNCSGVDDDARVYIRVTPLAQPMCAAYSATYHF